MGKKVLRLQSRSHQWKLPSAVEAFTSGSCFLCLSEWKYPHCICQGSRAELYSCQARLQLWKTFLTEIMLSRVLSFTDVRSYLFWFLLAVGHVLTPHSWYHIKKWVWGVHLSQPGTIQRFGPEPFHTLYWFPVLLVSDLISHCQSHFCPTYLMFSIASPAKTICYFVYYCLNFLSLGGWGSVRLGGSARVVGESILDIAEKMPKPREWAERRSKWELKVNKPEKGMQIRHEAE